MVWNMKIGVWWWKQEISRNLYDSYYIESTLLESVYVKKSWVDIINKRSSGERETESLFAAEADSLRFPEHEGIFGWGRIDFIYDTRPRLLWAIRLHRECRR
jgi:hypothetical protein